MQTMKAKLTAAYKEAYDAKNKGDAPSAQGAQDTLAQPAAEPWFKARDYVTIDKAFLETGRSDAGGWSCEQLALVGVAWPPPAGWQQSVIGKRLWWKFAQRFLLAA